MGGVHTVTGNQAVSVEHLNPKTQTTEDPKDTTQVTSRLRRINMPTAAAPKKPIADKDAPHLKDLFGLSINKKQILDG